VQKKQGFFPALMKKAAIPSSAGAAKPRFALTVNSSEPSAARTRSRLVGEVFAQGVVNEPQQRVVISPLLLHRSGGIITPREG